MPCPYSAPTIPHARAVACYGSTCPASKEGGALLPRPEKTLSLKKQPLFIAIPKKYPNFIKGFKNRPLLYTYITRSHLHNMNFFKDLVDDNSPSGKVKKQLQDAGVDTSKIKVSVDGSRVSVSGTVSSQSDMNKINNVLKMLGMAMSISNNVSVASTKKNNDDEEEEDEEEEEEDDEEEEEDDEEYDADFIELGGKKLQLVLTALGYDLGRVDGIVGPKTVAALRDFQRDYELKATGKVDDETNQALCAAFCEDVEELSALAVQMILEDAGYSVGGVDGIMGPKTKLALRNFQEEYELDATGKLDDDTIAALTEVYVTA